MRLLLLLFTLVVALSPLPLGANRDWAWNPLGALVGVLLIGMAGVAWLDRDWQRRAFGSFRALLVPAVLFALVLAWGMVQLSGWTPADWATSLSPNSVLGGEPRRSIAFDSEQQWTAVLRLLAYGGVFALAAALGQQAVDARRILATIVVVATLTTTYAMAAEAINSQSRITHFSVWVPLEFYFTGTFTNANNYGTYAGVSALAALALAFRPAGRVDQRETSGERWRRRLAMVSGMSGLWLALALVLIMGVLLSGSRAATASLALGLMAMAAFYARGAGRVTLMILIPLVILSVVVFTPSGVRLAEKTARLVSEGEVGREGLYPMALSAIALRPMIGWGMNSFGDLYGVFQPVTLDVYFEKAHNTYLELAFDLGIPAACTLVLAVAWIVWRCLIGFATRGRDRELAGLGVFTTVLTAFHGLFDYSLQIPAFSCTYFAMLGIAWAQSWSSRQA